jgi:tRNA(Arg) A34 adenosine deaminase TadA
MSTTETDRAFLQQAIELAVENVRAGGGPFGALVVRAGTVVARGVNRVTAQHDPTAHAEVQALRTTGAVLKAHHFPGCTLYTSCEPCPMCLAAAYWARLDRVVYAATHQQAADAGFADADLFDEVARPPAARRLAMDRALEDLAPRPFEAWRDFEGRVEY